MIPRNLETIAMITASTPAAAMLAELHDARSHYRAAGHRTYGISIGAYAGQIRACDDNGAYDFHAGPHGWHATSVGAPSSTLQGIAVQAVNEINGKAYREAVSA